jgi:hypothetical protein
MAPRPRTNQLKTQNYVFGSGRSGALMRNASRGVMALSAFKFFETMRFPLGFTEIDIGGLVDRFTMGKKVKDPNKEGEFLRTSNGEFQRNPNRVQKTVRNGFFNFADWMSGVANTKVVDVPAKLTSTTSNLAVSQNLMTESKAKELQDKVNSKSITFSGETETKLGNVVEQVDKTLGVTQRVEKSITKANDVSLKKMRDSVAKLENKSTIMNNLKARLPENWQKKSWLKSKTMATDERARKTVEVSQRRLDAAKGRQKLFLSLPQEEQAHWMAKAEAASQRITAFETAAMGNEQGAAAKEAVYKAYKTLSPEERLQMNKDKSLVNRVASANGGLAITKHKIDQKVEKMGEKGQTLSHKAKKKINQYAAEHENIVKLEAKKEWLKDPVGRIKDRINNMTVSDAASLTLQYGNVALHGVSTYKGLKSEKQMLKLLIADIRGVKPESISNWNITVMTLKNNANAVTGLLGFKLFAEEPKVIQEALSQYGRSAAASSGVFAFSLFGQGALNKVTKNAALSAIITNFFYQFSGGLRARENEMQMGVQEPTMAQAAMGQQAQARRNAFHEVYAEYKMQLEQGTVLKDIHYLDLITTGSAAIRQMNGASNYKNVVLAQYFTINQTSLPEVLQHLNKDKKHIEALQATAETEVKAWREQQRAQAEQEQEVAANGLPDQTAEAAMPSTGFSADPRNQSKGGFDSFVEAYQNEGPAMPAGALGAG